MVSLVSVFKTRESLASAFSCWPAFEQIVFKCPENDNLSSISTPSNLIEVLGEMV